MNRVSGPCGLIIKKYNIHVIEFPEEERKSVGPEIIFEKIMAENFPSLVRERLGSWMNLKQDKLKEIHI